MASSRLSQAAERALGGVLLCVPMAVLGCSGEIDGRDQTRDNDGGTTGSVLSGGRSGSAGTAGASGQLNAGMSGAAGSAGAFAGTTGGGAGGAGGAIGGTSAGGQGGSFGGGGAGGSAVAGSSGMIAGAGGGGAGGLGGGTGGAAGLGGTAPVGGGGTGGATAGTGGSGGVGTDGCTDTLARNVTLSRIDAFQTVAVNIMEDGEELAGSARNTSLAAGRNTVFRIFVTPGSGATARELSARVTLVNGSASQEFFAKKNISRASSEDDPGTTFQVTAPAAQIKADTRYSVELVECGTPPSGEATGARFPAAEDASLGVIATGSLRVTIIPITSNSRAPDTSESALEPYRELLHAIYPVEAVEMEVGGGITAGYPVDWNGTLDAVRSKRQSDQPDPEVYYYGLIQPTETFREFCGGGCTAGIGFVPQLQDSSRRVSMGIGFPGDASPGAMAHEIGHNHGREHAPCVPQGSSISGVDRNYPYDGGNIGVWGYDQRSAELIDPDGITDMMGYCNDTWISDYTFDGIFTRVQQVNGAKIRVNPDVLGYFRVLLVDPAGPRWGRPIDELTAPDGAPELADIRDVQGSVIERAIVYRTRVSDLDAASILVPEPLPGWHSVQVDGSSAHPFSAPSLPPVQ